MLVYLTTAFVLYSFFRLDGPSIITQAVITRYERFMGLYDLVSIRKVSRAMIVWICFKIIARSFYLNFIQYMNDSVVQLDKNTYEISYVLKGQLYKMLVKPLKGPAMILQVSDENLNDLTDIVLPYMGPKGDWHGFHLSPTFFRCNSLTFEFADGTEKTFFTEDQVKLK